MFIKTVYTSEIFENVKENFELVKDDKILQIIYRGEGIKVLMTQEYFFDIIQRAKLYNEMINSENINTKKRFIKEEIIKSSEEKLALINEKMSLEKDS
ncbi:MAG: hypothetical protein K2X69_04265 [Silvanigrellaceae bacterium]|nr:hypothetical protein [Silvanigrellaceae bacterium]